MFRYSLKKIKYSFFVLWGVVTIVFLLFNVLPGDPARMMLDKREDAEQLQAINKKYGFDKSIAEQYFLYLNDVSPISIHNNQINTFTYLESKQYRYTKILEFETRTLVLKFPFLRNSFVSGQDVGSIILKTFPNTFILALTSILIALALGLMLGLISAVYKDSFLDKAILSISAIGMSVPSFFSAILIAWIFGFVLQKYTGLNMSGSLYEVDDYGRGAYLELKNLILPALTLGVRPLAVITQLCRNSVLEIMKLDYVRTATSKGLKKTTILFKHVLRNALNPVITVISGWFASLLAGAVFVEYIFGWNGIGKEIVDALNKLDLPVVMGSVLFIAFLFVLVNILVDLMYRLLDPRVNIE
jgi:peptide/nickel transport system permease protein